MRTFAAGSATGPAMALETASEAMVATMYLNCMLKVDAIEVEYQV